MGQTDLIDVVDENDTVVGNLPMAEVRRSTSIHRAVRVMVEKTDGSLILLQRRSDDEKIFYPGLWDNSAAGHVDSGEDYETAALRELHEEIGLKAKKLEFVGKYSSEHSYNRDLIRRFNCCYRYKTNKTPTILQAEEVAEIRWFSVEDIKKLIKESPDKVTDGLSDVIQKYY